MGPNVRLALDDKNHETVDRLLNDLDTNEVIYFSIFVENEDTVIVITLFS